MIYAISILVICCCIGLALILTKSLDKKQIGYYFIEGGIFAAGVMCIFVIIFCFSGNPKTYYSVGYNHETHEIEEAPISNYSFCIERRKDAIFLVKDVEEYSLYYKGKPIIENTKNLRRINEHFELNVKDLYDN